jgi:hypothetical protein
LSCLFCAEKESISHLFFGCCVAHHMWDEINKNLNVKCGGSYESIASLWLSAKKNVITNMLTAAVLWSIWKLRNDTVYVFRM